MAGINVFLGLSTGSFVAMLVIDYIYDFVVPISYLFTVLALCVGLCWGCVWCFDLEEQVEREKGTVELQPPAMDTQQRSYKTRRSSSQSSPSMELLEPLLE